MTKPGGESAKVAIVASSDYDFIREAVEALGENGIHSRQARSLQDCIRFLTGFTPDLIVLDMDLGEGQALQLCRTVSQHGVTGIPILSVAERSHEEAVKREIEVLGLRVHEFLSKPASAEDIALRSRVLIELGRSTADRENVEDTVRDPNKIRVLLIDDEEDQRTLLRIPLSMDYEVAEAENGLAGLVMLERFQPDVVVCDIMMPEMNGLETVEAVRKNPRFFDIPFFFLTGEKHEDLPELATELGANLFLRKPIDPMRLPEIIEEFVQQLDIEPRSMLRMEPALSTDVLESMEGEFAEPVRILIVDNDLKHISLYKEIRKPDPEGRWETYWNSRPATALANMCRIQPDLVIYNARTKVSSERFARSMEAEGIDSTGKLVLAAFDPTDQEREYQANDPGGEPIDLAGGEEAVTAQILERVRAKAGKVGPKRYTLEEISRQDQKCEADSQIADPSVIEKYKQMQSLIDMKG